MLLGTFIHLDRDVVINIIKYLIINLLYIIYNKILIYFSISPI